MAQSAQTVRVITDIRTYEADDLMKILKAQRDGLGDHMVSVVLPSLGFEGKAQAGGTIVHEHEAMDRTCKGVTQTDRLYRDDGNDEI